MAKGQPQGRPKATDLDKLHAVAKDAKGVVIDGKTQTVLIAGRRELDVEDTVMRVPIREMSSIAASLLLSLAGAPPMQIPDASQPQDPPPPARPGLHKA